MERLDGVSRLAIVRSPGRCVPPGIVPEQTPANGSLLFLVPPHVFAGSPCGGKDHLRALSIPGAGLKKHQELATIPKIRNAIADKTRSQWLPWHRIRHRGISRLRNSPSEWAASLLEPVSCLFEFFRVLQWADGTSVEFGRRYPCSECAEDKLVL